MDVTVFNDRLFNDFSKYNNKKKTKFTLNAYTTKFIHSEC